jgi:peptide/nickel transport system permease protein
MNYKSFVNSIADTVQKMLRKGLYKWLTIIFGCITLLIVQLKRKASDSSAPEKDAFDKALTELEHEGWREKFSTEAMEGLKKKQELLSIKLSDSDMKKQAAEYTDNQLKSMASVRIKKNGVEMDGTRQMKDTLAELLSNPVFFIISLIISLPMYLLVAIYRMPYVKYIIERVLMLILVIVGVITLVFTILYFSSSDPAVNILGQQATQEQIESFRHAYGLDKSYLEQLLAYIKNILTFNLGRSYIGNDMVGEAIGRKFPVTFKLSLLSMCIAIVIAIPAGIISAIKQYSILDYVLMLIALLGLSIPSFWFGMMLVLKLSIQLGWLPATFKSGQLISMLMPATVLGTAMSAGIARMTRSSMLEVKHADYVVTARAKGLSEGAVTLRHILTNAMIPIITMIGIQFGGVLGGSASTEKVFNVNGLGTYIINSEYLPDVPVVLAGVVYVSLVVSVANLLVDLLYTFIDPRIKTKLKNY